MTDGARLSLFKAPFHPVKVSNDKERQRARVKEGHLVRKRSSSRANVIFFKQDERGVRSFDPLNRRMIGY